MKLIREFLSEIDAHWKPIGAVPIRLRIIGSAALMLQTDYQRGTKDGGDGNSRKAEGTQRVPPALRRIQP